ncbi:MAG: AraC family transcriptional regulator [Bifidobacteriaceae bacterium]|jgi:AraC-like DNA-binding protein|nr:AraC family transcriptional regulator [Bifidobacteriaceae bacterium]
MPLSRAESKARQRELVSLLDPPMQFTTAFDHVRGVHFFVKDRTGAILFASLGLAQLYGFKSEDDFIGRTDFDVLPVGLAAKFKRDDDAVLSSGRPMVGIVELFLSTEGIPDWFLTNKFPLWSRSGQVVGLMGTIQEHRAAAESARPPRGIDVAVARLRADPGEDLSVDELAQLCRMSIRQFQTKFKAAYGLPPSQFKVRVRVMKACELLRDTDLPVCAVAEEVGFYDQSALAHHFRSVIGYSPLQYRKRLDGAA